MTGPPDRRDVALGVVVAVADLGTSVARLVARAPIVGAVVNRAELALAADGREAREQGLAELEGVAVRVLEADELERIVLNAVDSQLTAKVVDRILSSPEVQAALARQTTSFAEELLHRLRLRLQRVDDRLSTKAGGEYAGLATRTVALGVDVALVTLAVLVVTAFAGLIASLVVNLRPAWLVGALAGAGWYLAVGAYLVFFWTIAGQSLGMRLLRLRVVDPRGQPPSVARALVRLAGLVLAIIPLFAGFIPIAFTRRRRGLQDFLAGTVVRTEDPG
jgi:uncharacterized RDD family membrane protein YckC